MQTTSELLKKYGFEEEEIELAQSRKGGSVFGKTGYPEPDHRYSIVTEAYNQSIEEVYFWNLNWAEHNQGYPRRDIEKITDIFTASEQSAFFGVSQQRLGIQQDKVSQFLATVGKMVKELFQLVRELRILDERLAYYRDSKKAGSGAESAEITLKGIWIDQVEQGAKNPASVYGMARELQFVTLPDLFFKYHPQVPEDVDRIVDALDFNRKVKEVLKRKLRSYIEWKIRTEKEIGTRRIFTVRYLRQHYDIIKLYLSWVRPYLRNIRRMQHADRSKSPDLISAFEGSMVELEFLAKKMPQSLTIEHEVHISEHVYSVILATFNYRTRPSMNYSQEYQKGPLHFGRTEVTLRAYAWKKEDIENYKKVKEEEDFEMLLDIDASLKAAMEGLGDELKKYLQEAGEKFPETPEQKHKRELEEQKKKKRPGAADPFASLLKGFGELGTALAGKGEAKKKGKKKIDPVIIEHEKSIAKSEAKINIWYMYKDFKKTHGMLTW